MKSRKNIAGRYMAYWTKESNVAHRLMGLMALMGLMSLMGSCSEEGKPELFVDVVSYVANFEEEIVRMKTAQVQEDRGFFGETRAWTPPAGYTAYEEGDNPIGVWLTQDGESSAKKLDGFFFKSSGKWRTNLELTVAGSYYLYGYIPHISSISSTIAPGPEDKYQNGATLTLENVPAVMSNDLCVVIGAKEGPDKEHDNGLRRGDFAYMAKPVMGGGEEPAGNFVFLLFDHLYASMRIRMRVYDDYNALRTIKLKKMELQTQAGTTPSKEKTNIAITLVATPDDSTDPITNITYTPSGEAITDGIEFSSSSAGETLTTEYSLHTGYFMPIGISKLVLTSTYDVYDKKENLIRKDCKATMTMVLKDMITGQETTLRGRRYTISMTIKPTFLYQLSEPDLDNPTMEIN